MSTRADTDLLWLQTRATSLSGVDCYDMTAPECQRVIADCQPNTVIPEGILDRVRLNFEQQFAHHFGSAK